MEDLDVFKVLSTTAVVLFGTWWAFRNLRFINDWIAEKFGLPTSDDRDRRRTSNTSG